jgi:hypothetical protein
VRILAWKQFHPKHFPTDYIIKAIIPKLLIAPQYIVPILLLEDSFLSNVVISTTIGQQICQIIISLDCPEKYGRSSFLVLWLHDIIGEQRENVGGYIALHHILH